MPVNKPDPTADIFLMMDQAGLSVPSLMDTKRPISKIVNKVRMDLAASLTAYIIKRDEAKKPEDK